MGLTCRVMVLGLSIIFLISCHSLKTTQTGQTSLDLVNPVDTNNPPVESLPPKEAALISDGSTNWLSKLKAYPKVSVRDFGAVCDGITDDAPAIRNALSSGKNVYFPSCDKPYLINSFSSVFFEDLQYVFSVPSRTAVFADTSVTLKVGDGLLNRTTAARGSGVFLAQNQVFVAAENLTVDMNGLNNLVPDSRSQKAWQDSFHDQAAQAFYLIGTDLYAKSLTVKDNPGMNNFIVKGTNCTLQDTNSINGGTSLLGNTNQFDFSAIYVACNHSMVTGNRISHEHYPFTNSGGIEIHSSDVIASNNAITRSYPGMLLMADSPDSSVRNVTVDSNSITDSYGDIGIQAVGIGADFYNITISNNTFGLTHFPTFTQTLPMPLIAIYQARDDTGQFPYTAIINNSRITNNKLLPSQPLIASVGEAVFLWISATNGLVIDHNQTLGTSGIGMAFIGAPSGIKNTTVSDNEISDFGQNTGPYGHWAFVVDLKLQNFVYNLDGLRFRNNRSQLSTLNPNSYAYYFDWAAGADVKGLEICGTTISNIGNLAQVTTRSAGLSFLDTCL